MSKEPVGRRARYRTETREEAKAIALRQLAEGGIGAVSLNAIGKEMGVTGPALYRYFASRDDLLSGLIIDAYSDLAAAVELAARQGDQGSPRECLRVLAEATRTWALAQPHRYLLLYGTPVPGYVAPDDTVPLARRVLAPFLDALSALPVAGAPTGSRRSALETQLTTWIQATNPHTSGPVLRHGLVWWTRLHGLISLEVEGHFALMGFDPALLYTTEVDALLDDIGAVIES
ncbi:MAG: TetR/AcrR family transcriptional regulator [Chloroflexi bacterium]|nr:TetR/AcrR family transcriptional regulator [Chloroflexota bacterium]